MVKKEGDLGEKVIGEQRDTAFDPFNFQEAMADAPEFGADLVKNNNELFNNAAQRINITRESIRHYMDDRTQDNHEMIMARNKPFLADLYQNLMQEYPCLNNVLVKDKYIKGNAFFDYAAKSNDGSLMPAVNFNFTDTGTYLKPEQMKEGDNFGLEHVLKTIALRTGAKPSEMMRNERLVTSFILLHEFGHALDFRRHYLDVELNKLEGSGKGIRALPEAINKTTSDRLKDLMTQPIPGQVQSDKLLELTAPFARRLEALGIDPNSRDEVVESLHKGYREMSSEAYADNFATSYIMRHYDDFFETADAENGSSEKVKTHVGELMKINTNLSLLNLVEGKGVKVKKVELQQNEKRKPTISLAQPVKMNKGFLAEKIMIGKRLQLLKEGDPTTKEKYEESPEVRNVYIRPRKDESGKLVNDIIIQFRKNEGDDKSGYGGSMYYLIEPTGEEPKEIDVSAEEILDRYKLGFGSKIMLMKRNLEGDSLVQLGAILGGKLADHYQNGSPIKENCGIYLTSSVGEKTGVGDLVDPDYMGGGNTSHIQRIYRKWKKYFVETTTSTYEVIPYI